MRYIITESRFNEVVKKLRKSEELDKNEVALMKLLDSFLFNLFDGIKEGEPLRIDSQVRTWYVSGKPVVGLNWAGHFNFDQNMVETLRGMFDLESPQAKLMLRRWIINNIIER